MVMSYCSSAVSSRICGPVLLIHKSEKRVGARSTPCHLRFSGCLSRKRVAIGGGVVREVKGGGSQGGEWFRQGGE